MTDIFLHNTLSRAKEKFVPSDADNVRMYVCGPTVYDFAHLGNARPVVVFDTLYRLLKRHYPRVTYVRNITDVDDKIMAKAKESGESIDAITTRTTQAFHDDMAALNALPPDIEPRCTQHIPQMIAMIDTLVKKKHAYAIEGHVLFHVPSMANYGALSRRSRDELVAGARVEVAPYKKDAADFVLWKPSAADQVGWDSPWGHGRPGWHIECSAMAAQHLGTTFDIHGGGLDLIFPHHENEIAQSRCAHDGAPLAKIWMHNGFLTINSDKMSKSLKNFFTVRELLAVAPGEALRLALLSGHYRSPLDFSIEILTQSKVQLDRWYRALQTGNTTIVIPDTINKNLEDYLCDDLNTPAAIAWINELASLIFQQADTSSLDRVGTSKNAATAELVKLTGLDLPRMKGLLKASCYYLGLLQQSPEDWFRWQPVGQSSGPTDADIDAQIAARLAARQAKNYAESDRIRDALAAQGIVLEDSAAGTIWRRG